MVNQYDYQIPVKEQPLSTKFSPQRGEENIFSLAGGGDFPQTKVVVYDKDDGVKKGNIGTQRQPNRGRINSNVGTASEVQKRQKVPSR